MDVASIVSVLIRTLPPFSVVLSLQKTSSSRLTHPRTRQNPAVPNHTNIEAISQA